MDHHPHRPPERPPNGRVTARPRGHPHNFPRVAPHCYIPRMSDPSTAHERTSLIHPRGGRSSAPHRAPRPRTVRREGEHQRAHPHHPRNCRPLPRMDRRQDERRIRRLPHQQGQPSPRTSKPSRTPRTCAAAPDTRSKTACARRASTATPTRRRTPTPPPEATTVAVHAPASATGSRTASPATAEPRRGAPPHVRRNPNHHDRQRRQRR